MSRLRSTTLFVVSALAIAGCTNPSAPPGPPQPQGPISGNASPAQVEAIIRNGHDRLGITPAQEPQYAAFAQTLRQSAAEMQSMMAQRAQNAATATAPEDMRARERILQTRMNYMHRAMAANDALYAVLTPEQRKTFDRMLTGYNEGARLPTGAPPAPPGASPMYQNTMVGGCGLLCQAGISE
jgi:hypothetical protein